MSHYMELETEFEDLDQLVAACEAAGLADQVKVYDQANGVYRKWTGTNKKTHDNATGYVRGRDAVLVIHGGLDTWEPTGSVKTAPRTDGLRGGPGWYCGDTAFTRDPETGRLVAHVDVAHGNANINWQTIQANYTALGVEKIAAEHGLPCQRTVNNQGRIVLRVEPAQAGRLIQSRIAVRG